MEEEKKLYPFRFCSLEDNYSWGKEEFEIADLGYRDSLVHDGWLAGNSIGEIMDMYMDRVVGENVFEFWGRQFPVTVKKILVKGRMPLRVHPDDEISADRYDFLGKEKLWYVLRTGRNASLMLGFRRDTDASEVYEKCADNSIDSIMNIVAPHAGQYFRIPPGTPHAAEGDIEILEISESSPLDFCMCGWGSEVSEDEFDPSLSLVEALDFINYNSYVQLSSAGKIVDIPQFCITAIRLPDPVHVYSETFDSFEIYSCLKGAASIQLHILGQTADYALKEGETVLVPAECQDFFIVPTAKDTLILETTIPYRKEKDPYINQ